MALKGWRLDDLPGARETARVRLPGVPAKAPTRPARLVGPSLRLVVVVPLVTRSEANLRDWRARSRRTKAAREAWYVEVGLWLVWRRTGQPMTVTLTRLGGRELDDDNLRSAMKGLRDVVAEWLQLPDDRDPSVAWRYGQEPGGAYGVRVEIMSVLANGV